MRRSRLPEGGENLFQSIKTKCAEEEAKGKKIYRLSIGQPAGPALLSARKAAAEAVMSDAESMHEYQDNGSPGVPMFAQRFIQAHFSFSIEPKGISYLPIPGIKSMLGLVQLACRHNAASQITVGYVVKPGYPTPADWGKYLGLNRYFLPLNPQNEFRFNPDDIPQGTNLLMIQYPHNPSGQIATMVWLQDICRCCSERNIRIFNDNPYYILSHSPLTCSLTQVAQQFSDLSWAEAFSASKVISNGCGWRVGAMVGSDDFIGDIKTIKGNTDSGFNAFAATGVLYAIENDKQSIAACREKYRRRIDMLSEILLPHGLQPAVDPAAGFFTLWRCPDTVFGKRITSAKEFNFAMIEQTGICGVHFDPYIRYSVTGDVEAMANVINDGFAKAKVSYD